MTDVRPGARAPLVVLDTVVVVRGTIGRRDGADAQILRTAAIGDVRLAVSDDGLRELQRVMGYESVRGKFSDPARAFATGLDIGIMGELFRPRRHDWPTLPDPKDRWILDLAYEAGSSESRAPPTWSPAKATSWTATPGSGRWAYGAPVETVPRRHTSGQAVTAGNLYFRLRWWRQTRSPGTVSAGRPYDR